MSGPDPDPDGDPRPPSRETLSLVHHHPGRLRVRADALRLGEIADRVRAALDAEPGIAAFSHNARTGSVLVEYQPGLADSESILARIAEAAGLEMPSDDGPIPRKPALIAIDAAREMNELVADLTGEKTDLRGLVPMGMAALAAYSFAYSKETRLPRWDNLLYWSYNIFTQLHRREIDAAGRDTGRDTGREGGAPETAGPEGGKPRNVL